VRRFVQLFRALDETTRTNEKVDAMARYFREAPPADAAWAVYFLTGSRPKRLIAVRKLATWAAESASVPEWLFEECYHTVGDLAETIALLLPVPSSASDRPLHQWVEQEILPLGTMSESAQRSAVLRAWSELSPNERFIWNKLVTGGFRVGVSTSLVVRAIARVGGVSEDVVAHRLSGEWRPTAVAWSALLSGEEDSAVGARPYPFFLAHALDGELDTLGTPDEWQAEWKWDGIRAQVVRRADEVHIWSRGEELVTDRFPEIAEAARFLPDGTVLDGELLAWAGDTPQPFAQLQRRIGRKVLTPRILSDVPVVLIVYDVLEWNGADLRSHPLSSRRHAAERIVTEANAEGRLRLSPIIPLGSWDDARSAWREAREHQAEGLMLKRLDAPYGVGRRKGSWWKWKVAPYVVDAVMIYAQAGHGRRAALHTDYTFAVWDAGTLVPFAKAYSGLTDDEIRALDAWIRRNTVEKFGPVRSVKPEQVFELAFEGIQRSTRHKSGVAVRFPRIARWRTDKPATEADTLETLHALLKVEP
jgi:DNA ligase 1